MNAFAFQPSSGWFPASSTYVVQNSDTGMEDVENSPSSKRGADSMEESPMVSPVTIKFLPFSVVF